MRHWTKSSTKFNKAKRVRGAEGLYKGYPSLLWYCETYRLTEVSIEELEKRRFELDAELTQILYSIEALKLLGSHIRSLEQDANIDKRMINEVYNLFGQISNKIENRKNVVGLDLEFVDSACVEWKKRDEKSRIIVNPSA